MNSTSSASQEFWQGIRAELPILVGVVPFGMIYGISALAAGMTPGSAQAMSSIVFAGSAQFVMVQQRMMDCALGHSNEFVIWT